MASELATIGGRSCLEDCEGATGRLIQSSSVDPLPIDAHIPEIAAALDRHRAAVVVAAPGAGKTTRVPPALAASGRVLLLQPRRAAARAIAQRIAAERGWIVGRQIGWHVRLDRRFSDDTRLLVATEGILTARLQQDPLLSAFQTIVLDEFHERSIHADLGLALAKQAWLARDDLRILVMSATLDADRVAVFLNDCPVISVAGLLHPIDISYAPGQSAADAVADLVGTPGSLLCFQPGAVEIQKVVNELRRRVPTDISILPLHGSLPPDQQDLALAQPSANQRRIIVSTNIAETSVTVPDVRCVIDSGLQKVARYDAARAIDSLATERITLDAADQRAGRAGRIGPGIVRRLWDERDKLRPRRDPDIHRIDLSSAALDIFGWGGDPRTFHWFEPPRPDALAAAVRLLTRLGAVENGRMTEIGRRMQQLPLHPRLARIVLEADGSRDILRACAILSERLFLPPRAGATSSDLLSAIDDWEKLPGHVQQVARELEQQTRSVSTTFIPSSDERDLTFRKALLTGYPDRVAQRREPRSPRVRLASGAGATVSDESGVIDAAFILALDVQASARASDPDARVRLASAVDKDWLAPTSREINVWLDDSGNVRAADVERYDALVLGERPVKADDERSSGILARAWLARPIPPDDSGLIRRLAFAGIECDIAQLVEAAAYGCRSLRDVHLSRALSPDIAHTLDRAAPASLKVPSGRVVPLIYSDDGVVSAAVKLQELFGLAETPRIGPRAEPLVFSLLAPNGRPVQTTRDLKSFWNNTYPEVRKELRGRYPKHPWPEDPWNAAPTARTKRRS